MSSYKKLKTKNKKEKLKKQIFAYVLLIIAINFGIDNMKTVRAFTVSDKIVIENNNESIDICGLQEVVCEGEDNPRVVASDVKPVAQDNVPSSVEAELESLISREFGDDGELMIAIAKAESNLQPERVGDLHLTFNNGTMGMSCGLFQIRVLDGRPDCDSLKNPEFNIKWAKKIKESQGLTAWTVYNNGRYLEFLKQLKN
ncbi:MAG TPA: hypothetical protein DDY21_00155 [Candidatus Moranbacteria bacterium]|nr:hypothetical protein [Candidatus Moranbacteria bacterium]